MPDSGIKKTRIKRENLPAINTDIEGYIVRYRILSEDKNRFSHWSPIKTILPEYTYVPGSINHNKSGSISTVAWNAVTINKDSKYIATAQEYDIWVKWDRGDSGDWVYRSRIENTSIALLTPTEYTIGGVVQGSAPNRLSVEIYLKGNPISRDSTFLRVYQGGPWTV
jgi:hypothetical protein